MIKWFREEYIENRQFQYITKAILIVFTPIIVSFCIAVVDWSKLSNFSFALGEQSLIGIMFIYLIFAAIAYCNIFDLDYKINQNLEDRISELKQKNKEYLGDRDDYKKELSLWIRVINHINRIVARKSHRLLEAIIKKEKKPLKDIFSPDLQMQENISQLRHFFEGGEIDPIQNFRVTLMAPRQEDGLEYLKIMHWDNAERIEPRTRLNAEYAKRFQKGKTVAGYAWAQGDLVIIENCKKELQKGRSSIFEIIHSDHHDIGSMFSYPIFDRELHEPDLLAVLNVDTNISNFFKKEDNKKIKSILEHFRDRLIFEVRTNIYIYNLQKEG